MKKIAAVLLILVLATLACSKVSNLVPTSSNNPNQPPVDIQPTAAQQSSLLFADDFSNTSSGWDKVQETNKVTDYDNGRYRMWLNDAQFDIWANPAQGFDGPVSVEVDASKSSGPDVNDFGIICDYQDAQNFYFGLVSSDGKAVIGKNETGTTTFLSASEMQPVSGVNIGNASNHLRLDCISGNLTLYANGNQVAFAQDASFSSGDVGLQIGTFDEVGVEIFFDNFVVTKP